MNVDNGIISNLVLQGDISKMTADQRTAYYKQFCESLGLNPLTQPFQILKLKNGSVEKEILYATKDCTEQLRKLHGVSITGLESKELRGVYIVTASAKDKNERTDASTGVVSLAKPESKWDDTKKRYVPTGKTIELTGDDLANALMKAETKAKRRVTLSICGLGMLDESEIETIPDAQVLKMDEKAQSPQPVKTPIKIESSGKPSLTDGQLAKAVERIQNKGEAFLKAKLQEEYSLTPDQIKTIQEA